MKKRIDVLRQKMGELGLDGFLVSNFYNIFYLSGFKGLSSEEREAWMLVTQKNIYFFTDGRYEEEVRKSITSESHLKLLDSEKNLITYLNEIVIADTVSKIGFESGDLAYAEYERLAKHLTLVPTDKIIITIREIKDNTEIAAIKKACEITNGCLQKIKSVLRVGVTEFEIAYKIEQYLKERRLDLAFYPIVAIGKNAALPHYDTKLNGKMKIRKNSLVLIDFGARFNNYLSDMTRMIFIGKPKTEIVNVYNVLLNAQQKTISELKKSNDPKHIDLFCRNLVTSNELPSYPHSTGHGVGLEIHEYPKISSKSTDLLQKGQVLTIEPGIYMRNEFGMRIEDTVLLKDDKTPEILTKFPKEMMII